MTPRPSRRDVLRAGTLSVGSLAVFSACTDSAPPRPPAIPGAGPSTTTAAPTPTGTPVDSWAPRPVRTGDLAVSAGRRGDRLALHTAGGDRTFWVGVGLSSALPGHLPEDFAPRAEDYRRWFPMLAQVGVRVIRLDSLQSPQLYAELLAYNEAHPDAPLYVLQGISIPELRVPTASPREITSGLRAAFSAEIAATSDAVHGDLVRTKAGRGPTGTWTADVSPYLAGWILGGGWEPNMVLATDRARRAKPFTGTYVATTSGATATETWLAHRMEELATLEAKRGSCAPIAVGNRPHTDPLPHPQEPVRRNDLVGIDVNHIHVRPSWPAGTFAAYAAQPYDPKFLRYQDAYQLDNDPYRSYLTDLKTHHAGMPLLMSEFGVPASLGRSDNGPNDQNNGFHSEQQAMKLNADMLLMFEELGLTGGLLRAWQDDWSATAPPTAPRTALVAPARRALSHDPLTSTQWTGLLAHEPARLGEKVVHDAPADEMTRVTVDQDASYLYLTFFFTRRVTSPVDVGFDLYDAQGLRLPGGSGDAVFDVALRLVPTMSTVTMFVRRTLDPARLDDLPTLYLPRANIRGWVVEQLTLAPPLVVPGRRLGVPAEMLKVGEMVLGSWDPTDPAYSSLATWQLVRPDPEKPMEWRLRLPWSMLTFADPSQRKGLVPDLGEPTLVDVPGMDVTVESSTPGSPAAFHVDFEGWDALPAMSERVRSGVEVLREAFAETTSRRND